MKLVRTQILEMSSKSVKLLTTVKRVTNDTLGFYIPKTIERDFGYGTIVEVTLKKKGKIKKGEKHAKRRRNR
jgi:hypothetical protein